jgi:hypothetical protein
MQRLRVSSAIHRASATGTTAGDAVAKYNSCFSLLLLTLRRHLARNLLRSLGCFRRSRRLPWRRLPHSRRRIPPSPPPQPPPPTQTTAPPCNSSPPRPPRYPPALTAARVWPLPPFATAPQPPMTRQPLCLLATPTCTASWT